LVIFSLKITNLVYPHSTRVSCHKAVTDNLHVHGVLFIRK